ncbi:MAG: hypothetical protein ACTSRI_12395 [Promethearchaeota archaeon]
MAEQRDKRKKKKIIKKEVFKCEIPDCRDSPMSAFQNNTINQQNIIQFSEKLGNNSITEANDKDIFIVKKITNKRKNLIQELYDFLLNLKKHLELTENYNLIKIIGYIFYCKRSGQDLKSPIAQKISQLIQAKLIDLVEKYKNSNIQTYRTEVDYETIKNHFFLILNIIDFIFGVSITKMKEKFHMTDSTINQMARMILGEQFNIRFKNAYPDNDIIDLARDVKEEDFKNFLNPQLQELFFHYREILKKNSPNNIIRISRDFTLWLKHIDNIELNHILRKFNSISPKEELLIKCEMINKNSEVVKFIIYKILETEESSRQIAKKAGVSKTTVMKYKKLLKKEDNKINQEKIREIVNDVLNNKINAYNFQNFVDLELQLYLKEYIERNKNEKYLIRPIHSFKIINDFKDWLVKKDANLIRKIILINKNNEILKCVLYKMLIDKWVPVDIAKKYSIPRKKVQKIANFLGLYQTLSIKELRDKIIEKIEFGDSIEDISQDLNFKEDLIIDLINIMNEIRDFQYGRSLTRIAEHYEVSRRSVTDIAKKILNPDLFNIRFNDSFFSLYRNIGITSHKNINYLLTSKLKCFYYSEIKIFLNNDVRIDGLLINHEEFSQKVLVYYSDLNLNILNYKFILFDFTSNLDENNIINKVKKYYTPYTILFIVGITDMPSKVVEFPSNIKFSEKEKEKYLKNVKIIRYDLFIELMSLNEDEINIFNSIVNNNINVNKYNINSNLEELSKLENILSEKYNFNHINDLKEFLKNYKDLKQEFIKIQNFKRDNQIKIDDY